MTSRFYRRKPTPLTNAERQARWRKKHRPRKRKPSAAKIAAEKEAAKAAANAANSARKRAAWAAEDSIYVRVLRGRRKQARDATAATIPTPATDVLNHCISGVRPHPVVPPAPVIHGDEPWTLIEQVPSPVEQHRIKSEIAATKVPDPPLKPRPSPIEPPARPPSVYGGMVLANGAGNGVAPDDYGRNYSQNRVSSSAEWMGDLPLRNGF